MQQPEFVWLRSIIEKLVWIYFFHLKSIRSIKLFKIHSAINFLAAQICSHVLETFRQFSLAFCWITKYVELVVVRVPYLTETTCFPDKSTV